MTKSFLIAFGNKIWLGIISVKWGMLRFLNSIGLGLELHLSCMLYKVFGLLKSEPLRILAFNKLTSEFPLDKVVEEVLNHPKHKKSLWFR